MDGQLLFYRTFPAAAGVPIREENVTEKRSQRNNCCHIQIDRPYIKR